MQNKHPIHLYRKDINIRQLNRKLILVYEYEIQASDHRKEGQQKFLLKNLCIHCDLLTMNIYDKQGFGPRKKWGRTLKQEFHEKGCVR